MGGRCAVCEREIEQKGVGRRRRTCSAACRQKAYRQRKRAQELAERARAACAWCGAELAPRQISFCSTACRERARDQREVLLGSGVLAWLREGRERGHWALYQWAADRMEKGEPVPVCPVCGMVFRDEKETGRPRVYCSDGCRRGAHQMRWRECPTCGERFERVDSRGRLSKVYCSRVCGDRARKARQRAREREARARAEWEAWTRDPDYIDFGGREADEVDLEAVDTDEWRSMPSVRRDRLT